MEFQYFMLIVDEIVADVDHADFSYHSIHNNYFLRSIVNYSVFARGCSGGGVVWVSFFTITPRPIKTGRCIRTLQDNKKSFPWIADTNIVLANEMSNQILGAMKSSRGTPDWSLERTKESRNTTTIVNVKQSIGKKVQKCKEKSFRSRISEKIYAIDSNPLSPSSSIMKNNWCWYWEVRKRGQGTVSQGAALATMIIPVQIKLTYCTNNYFEFI